MKDYYKILELDRNAGIKEIRKSYRKLALKLHPDVNSAENAEMSFIQIGEAYEVLKNPRKKLNYDRLYDYKILNKRSKRPRQYQNRNKAWEEAVRERQKKGRYKAKRDSKKNYEKLKRKSSKNGFFDWFWGILEFIINSLEIFTIFG